MPIIRLNQIINQEYKHFKINNDGIRGTEKFHGLTEFQVGIMSYFFQNPEKPASLDFLKETFWNGKNTDDNTVKALLGNIKTRLYEDECLLENDPDHSYALCYEPPGLGYYSREIRKLIIEKQKLKLLDIPKLLDEKNINLDIRYTEKYLKRVCNVDKNIPYNKHFIALKNPSQNVSVL